MKFLFLQGQANYPYLSNYERLFRLKNTSSKLAGALRPVRLLLLALNIAFLIDNQAEIASISGGSPTALTYESYFHD